MVETLEALGLLVLVVLPGAVATFSYERHAGPIAGEFNERILRFILATALIAPLPLWLGWIVWTNLLHEPTAATGEFRNRLSEVGRLSPLWLLLPVAYVALPWVTGRAFGRARVWWLRRNVSDGEVAARLRLRAWDFVFVPSGPKLVSCRMRDGKWIAGLLGGGSFASPLASPVKELVLETCYEVDDKGTVVLNEYGVPIEMGGSILIHAADVDLVRVERT